MTGNLTYTARDLWSSTYFNSASANAELDDGDQYTGRYCRYIRPEGVFDIPQEHSLVKGAKPNHTFSNQLLEDAQLSDLVVVIYTAQLSSTSPR